MTHRTPKKKVINVGNKNAKGPHRKPDWNKLLKRALEQEDESDAREIVELVRRLYWLLIAKRNK